MGVAGGSGRPGWGVPAAAWDDRVLLCPRGAGAAGDGCALGQPSNSYLGTLSHKTAERRWSSRCPGLSVGFPGVGVPTGPCLGCLLCLQPGSPEWAGSWASRPRAPSSVLCPRKLRRKGPQSPAPTLERPPSDPGCAPGSWERQAPLLSRPVPAWDWLTAVWAVRQVCHGIRVCLLCFLLK